MFKPNQWGINISLGIILTLIASINLPVQAQSSDNEGYQTNEKDTTYGDTPGGLNPLDIMHQAQQANRRSAAEFNAESQGQLDASVSDFKRLQQQRILEQQRLMKSQPSPETVK
ncbi:hypothetical protein NIES4102_14550 [Chondrocystis sp. NIES-4102]|nr:hypothetical protein NIES4102_14550 [Chondrocystis sp. NIES-4102]